MGINIFNQETEIGRSRLNIVQLSIFTLGLTATSVSTVLSVIGILPVTPMVIGIPIAAITGLLAFFCFMPLVTSIIKHTRIDSVTAPMYRQLTEEERIHRRQKRYSLPNGKSDGMFASSDSIPSQVNSLGGMGDLDSDGVSIS